MKKIFPALAAIILILTCITLAACTGKEEKEESLSYEMSLSLTDGVLSGEQTVRYTNVYVDGLGQSVFHLYPNAYAEGAADPAYNASLISYGGIDVESVKVNGTPTEYTLSENRQYLTVPHSALKKGEEIAVEFIYKTTVPTCNLRLGKGADAYTLSGFYPQLSVYDGECFRTDKFSAIGDPIYSSCADYNVSFECDSSLVVCSSMKIEGVSTQGTRQTLKFVGEDMRDVAIICNPDYNVINGKAGDVTVYYFYKTDENAQETLDLAVSALNVFGETFGKYPYEVYTVARAPFMCDGMEFSGLSLIAESCTDIENAVLHETAHQWWYGIVGNDPINESYMDEGLATFCAAYYYELIGKSDRFSEEINAIKRGYTSYERLQQRRKTGASLSMNRPVYEFTDYQYTMVEYFKGCMMFDCIRELYGNEKFNACLSSYAEKNKFGFGGKDAFVEAAKGSLGDIGGLTEGWIGEKVVATTFAEVG